jgi:proteasome assembly chaperone (PAC2) family protein
MDWRIKIGRSERNKKPGRKVLINFLPGLGHAGKL